MNPHASILSATAALAVLATAAHAAPKGTLEILIESPSFDANASGLIDLTIRVRAIGTANPGLGDGGLASFGFEIHSIGSGRSNAVPQAPSGPLSTKAKFIWSPDIVPPFSKVDPSRLDRSSDGDFDAAGTAFFLLDLSKTDLAADDYVTVGTAQFQFTSPWQPDGWRVVVDNAQFYDFVDGTGDLRLNTFATIHDAVAFTPIPPEPGSLTIAIVAALLAGRRRAPR